MSINYEEHEIKTHHLISLLFIIHDWVHEPKTKIKSN